MSFFGLLFVLSLTSIRAQPLDTLVQQSLRSNLSLQARQYEYQAALERAPQVRQLPQPELAIGAFAIPIETRLGPQRLRAGATQAFPWFGTLDQKEELAQAQARTRYESIGAQALELEFQLRQAYYQLYGIRKSQAIVAENVRILSSLEQLSLTKVENGQASAADVLRVQLKTEELKQQLQLLMVAETAPLATINQLRQRQLDEPLVFGEELTFAPLLYRKDSLLRQISEQHPMLRMYTRQQEVAEAAIALNELQGKPSFGLGVDYFWITPREDVSLDNNGRDALQLRASIKVPLYRQQYAAKAREERLRMEAIGYQQSDLLQRFMLDIEKAYARHETARLQSDLYRQQKELTAAAIRILRASYSTQTTNFDELLRLEKELLDYDLKLLQTVVESHLANNQIARYLSN